MGQARVRGVHVFYTFIGIPEAYLSYALFISLISKLFCTKGAGGGGEGPLEGVGPENHIKLTTCSTENRIQNTAAAKLMYIKYQ